MRPEAELRQVIAELSLVAQVPARGEPSPIQKGRKHFKGKEPDCYGAAEGREDDYEKGWPLKSPEHFERRRRGVVRLRDRGKITAEVADVIFRAITVEVRAALEAFRRMPAPTKQNEPAYGSPQWKRYIGESQESYRTLADRFNVSPQYIGEVRRRYLMVA